MHYWLIPLIGWAVMLLVYFPVMTFLHKRRRKAWAVMCRADSFYLRYRVAKIYLPEVIRQ